MNYNVYENIKNIDNEINNKINEIEELKSKRYALEKENVGWFIEVCSCGNGNYWDEYYSVPKYKKLECDLEAPDEDEDEDWDPGIAFPELENPWFQVSDEEYKNWKALAQLVEFNLHFDKYAIDGELLSKIFGENWSEFAFRLDDLINEYYKKVGLNHRSFQHIEWAK